MAKGTIVGNWAALLPTHVYLHPFFGMGPGALLGMLAHTEGPEGPGGAGSQAGRRGSEAPERKESAGPGVWGVGCFWV